RPLVAGPRHTRRIDDVGRGIELPLLYDRRIGSIFEHDVVDQYDGRRHAAAVRYGRTSVIDARRTARAGRAARARRAVDSGSAALSRAIGRAVGAARTAAAGRSIVA